ncbi:membrane dipeptidase [Chryseobacterium foetidum]|uniref:membrane dipeptidase n=1 Tax=Chryseobacterium foetidum TaxID=2951057 RepID=UPI0021C8ECA6|nr:membrane dipeptidase [Chryseobacterium foetidum]
MKYFDFHCHPILKQLFSDEPNIDSFISKNDLGAIPDWCSELRNVVQTQTNHSQLAEFKDEVVVGATLYSVEKYVAEVVNPLRKNLKKEAQFKLSQTLLKSIADNTYKPFSGFLMERTLGEYLRASSSYNILTKNSFNNPLPKNKVNIFFTIEGCHSLVDENNYCDATHTYKPAEILSNLDKVLEKVNILSINLTHLQQSSLCNHAFGMQVANIEPFVPKGNGLENDGKEVVQGIFDRKICVDVKHMSYKSRKDLMNKIDAGEFNGVQPVVCTHAGFTGITFKDWTKFIDFKTEKHGTWSLDIAKPINAKSNPMRPGFPGFNASSINLFDEEIAWIVKNKGVIGISLDKRILGFSNDNSGSNPDDAALDKEYFSKAEWDSLGLKKPVNRLEVSDDYYLTVKEAEDSPGDEYFQYSHFFNHLKHYFQVCVNNGISIETAQKHITIGTDYDGLISPFGVTPTVKDIFKLRNYTSLHFRNFLEDLSDAKIWSDQINMDVFMENLFYRNGYNFIKSRF